MNCDTKALAVEKHVKTALEDLRNLAIDIVAPGGEFAGTSQDYKKTTVGTIPLSNKISLMVFLLTLL